MSLFSIHDGFARIRGVRSDLVFEAGSGDGAIVSIAIPTYRRPNLLEEALSSAKAQEGFPGFEVVVVDNEWDATNQSESERVVRSSGCSRIRYYRNQQNLGMTGNWNRCIELSRGKWLTMLHDDDWLSPHFLSAMMKWMPDDAAMMSCLAERGTCHYSSQYTFAAPRFGRRLSRQSLAKLAAGMRNPAPGILIRRDVALKAGGFCDDYYPSADYALAATVAKSHPSYVLSAVLSYYRTTESQSNKEDTLRAIALQTRVIRREILSETEGVLAKFLAFSSSVWWCSYQRSTGFNLGNICEHGRWGRLCCQNRLPAFVLRVLAGLILRVT